MKTIKQISLELGVSRQAVYNKIKKEPLSTALQGLTVKVDNTLHFGVDSEQLIKSAFNQDSLSTVSTNTCKAVDSTCQAFIDSLTATITRLEHEMDVKNKLIDEQQEIIKDLNMTIRIQAESINAANKNELAETIIDGNKKLIGETQVKERGGIFKIFSRKK